MDKRYICYCGLYCGNCAVKAKVEPAAKHLYKEMKNAYFEDIIDMIPGGSGFWPFLKGMVEGGMCLSCCEGSGNPGCEVRICAQKKGVTACALCESYPCSHFQTFFQNYPTLEEDNAILRNKGLEVWGERQDERQQSGFTYSDENKGVK